MNIKELVVYILNMDIIDIGKYILIILTIYCLIVSILYHIISLYLKKKYE